LAAGSRYQSYFISQSKIHAALPFQQFSRCRSPERVVPSGLLEQNRRRRILHQM
jgi:hypothetical protein